MPRCYPGAFVQSQKTEVHAPGFLEFAKANSIKYVRKAHEKARQRRAFAFPRTSAQKRYPRRIPAVPGKAGGTAVRRITFPVKVRACTDFYSSARAAAALVRRADERLSPPVSRGTGGAYLKGTASPLEWPSSFGAQKSFS